MTPALYASRHLSHGHHNLQCENRTSLQALFPHERAQVSPSCDRLKNARVASRSPYPGLRASKHRNAVSDFAHPAAMAFMMREFYKLPCCHVFLVETATGFKATRLGERKQAAATLTRMSRPAQRLCATGCIEMVR